LHGLHTTAHGLHATAQGFTTAHGLGAAVGLDAAQVLVVWLEYWPTAAQGLLRQGGVAA